MVKIAIITGSTREMRLNIQVAKWVYNFAVKSFPDHYFEILDIKEFDFPRVEGHISPKQQKGIYNNSDVQNWADRVSEFDGYIFITPEYNNNITSTLKDALDHLVEEFYHKSAGIVSYGGSLGMAASVVLRVTLANFKLAVVSTETSFSLHTDFSKQQTFMPEDYHHESVLNMLSDTIKWAEALKTIRNT